jgi:diguanylate cyclase (GGDEF)-like protein
MPRRPRTVETTNPGPHNDAIANVMAMLLPVHAALTTDWLSDATATAAERTVNAAYTFIYLEQPDGTLAHKAAASDIRRRTEQKAIDVFGKNVLAETIDPAQAPGLSSALDIETPTIANASDLFEGRAERAALSAAQQALAIDELALVPLISAGERLGALLLMIVGRPESEHIRLLASHVACALVNLNQTASQQPFAATEVVRTVFDERKTEIELQRELLRAERYRREASICVIEATNLRMLRERFGTSLTERLLEKVGRTMAQHSRDIDAIGQYKESGYTMILSEASPEGAQLATKRLITIAQEGAADPSAPGLELHFAAGWASYPSDGRTTDALFAATKRRMYDPASQVA